MHLASGAPIIYNDRGDIKICWDSGFTSYVYDDKGNWKKRIETVTETHKDEVTRIVDRAITTREIVY